MTSLEIYKEMKEKCSNPSVFEIAAKILIYKSVEAFIENPTDEEYEIIAQECYHAFMKTEYCDLVKFSDHVSEAYKNKEITLEELEEMDYGDILEKYNYEC